MCRERGVTLKELLREAGVSRTAYYAMTRKESVLPRSVLRIAEALGVSPNRFLHDDTAERRHVRRLQEQANAICLANPECDPDVVFRTLRNLELKPVERLRRAMIRAQRKADLQ